MKRGREVKIFTPEEKLEWAMMRAIDRCEESLARIFRGGHDPEMAMLLQSAAQQEELEAVKKREDALWAMYAMCGGYMSKPQRERYHKLLKKLIELPDCNLTPSLRLWIEKGQTLKARVLGTSTDRPVRSKLGPHGSMAVNEMKKRQVDWIKESGRAMVEMLKMSPVTPVVGVGRGMRLSQRKKNRAAK